MPTSSLLAIFAFSFAIAIGPVMAPGPVSIAIISQALHRGWYVGPLVATGHSIMELLIVIMISIGLSSILAQPGIQVVLALSGGLLLFWMGGKILLEALKGKTDVQTRETRNIRLNSRQLIGLGVLTTLNNPFWYAWWITVAVNYLTLAHAASIGGILAFYLGHISADYTGDTMLSTLVGSGSKLLNLNVYRAIFFLCGGFLVYIGIQFLIQAMNIIIH